MAESGEKEQVITRQKIYDVLWPPSVNQQTLDALQAYDIRDDDVIIASYPKSGRELFFSVLNAIVDNLNLLLLPGTAWHGLSKELSIL